jgi:hypothetical protein
MAGLFIRSDVRELNPALGSIGELKNVIAHTVVSTANSTVITARVVDGGRDVRSLIARVGPEHHHRDECRHNRHDDATEDQHPTQRGVRPEGQNSSERRVGDKHPDQIPNKPLARPLPRTPSPHGHRLLHQSECLQRECLQRECLQRECFQSECLAPSHVTKVAYPLATRSASLI